LAVIKLIDYQIHKTSFTDVVLVESLKILNKRQIENLKTEAILRPLRRQFRSTFY